MPKTHVPHPELYPHVMRAMTSHGLLLGSYDADKKANLMTIGWGLMGSVWGIPIWTVLVRPSRYTYQCIEHSGCFTVNVPGDELGMACAVCGSRSGRDTDKIAQAKLSVTAGKHVLAPVVTQCPVTYECQVVHASDILPDKLTGEILSGSYLDGDYHRIYYGKILGVHVAPDAIAILGGK